MTGKASLSLLELDLAPAELLLDDFADELLEFTPLLEEAASLELDSSELDETCELLEATLELLGIDFHCADRTKFPDAVAGISVTSASPNPQPKNVWSLREGVGKGISCPGV